MRVLHDELRNETFYPVDPAEPNPCPECGAPLTEYFEGRSCLPTCTECAYSEKESVINMANDLNQKVLNLKAAIEDLKSHGVIAVGTNLDMKPYIQVYRISRLMQFDGPICVKERISDHKCHFAKDVEGVEVFCLGLPEELVYTKEGATHEDIKAAD